MYFDKPFFVKLISELIDLGADVNARNSDGYTILMQALMFRLAIHPDVIKLLIKAGADVNAKVEATWTTVLMIAAMFSHPLIVDWLIQAGANVRTKDKHLVWFGHTAIDYAKQNNNQKNASAIIKLLKAKG